MRIAMLTTSDNPFDPITQFDSWYQYDTEKGYNSCAYLARVANTSDSLSDAINNAEIERAIDEIVRLNVTGNYKKVVKEVEEKTVQ